MGTAAPDDTIFDEQVKVLDAALATYSKAVKLKAALLAQNASTLEVDQKLATLDAEILGLRKKLHTRWRQSTEAIRGDIATANANLQKSINKIKKAVEIAQYVVKALGYIDDVLAILGKIAIL